MIHQLYSLLRHDLRRMRSKMSRQVDEGASRLGHLINADGLLSPIHNAWAAAISEGCAFRVGANIGQARAGDGRVPLAGP
jgi:hypothetical protein